mmetsp:Transcript_2780/g.6195  ORF Transcript_2780/g.6195 Transcript_2780/m.6195 type:complete len:272 (+) Transcript_2780:3-818(+)
MFQEKERRKTWWTDDMQMFLNIFLILTPLWAYLFMSWAMAPQISCLPTQAMTRGVESFMPDEDFAWMQQCLEDHPLIGDQVLNPGIFSSTVGFFLAFNRAGIPDLRADPRFECLVPFFDRAHSGDANAFVLNLLVCHKPTNESDVVVDLHLDNSVGFWLKPTLSAILAHQVKVLYVSVPKDMSGGVLEVFAYNRGLPSNDEQVLNNPDKRVKPEENKMIVFRGDSYHRVLGYTTKTSYPRTSLVLEEYKVQPWLYPFTRRFVFEEKAMPMI